MTILSGNPYLARRTGRGRLRIGGARLRVSNTGRRPGTGRTVAVGTFLAQAIATGHVGRTAEHDKAAASGIYLASYYAGGLVGSFVLGQVFDRVGWPACVAVLIVALIAAIGLARALTVPAN